jgi:hypothetical protein
MKHDKICAWLGLPAGAWPPDHYTLLGLNPGEQDVARIEQHVHDRLAKLRCYQLSHPEQATEAMNRLAQAFMCLTDAQAKRTYDVLANRLSQVAEVVPHGPSGKAINGHASAEANRPAVAPDDTAVAVRPLTQVDWKNTPPPVRVSDATPPPSAPPASADSPSPANGVVPVANDPGQTETSQVGTAQTEVAQAPQAPQVSSAPPVSQPADFLYESARASVEARRGIGTLGALSDRIDHTRRLLWAWDHAGKYLNKTNRRLSRLAEQNDLNRWLEKIGELMEGFPRVLGQPGQPGYRIVAMARLEMTAVMFNVLDPHQREALARDWVAGRVVLLSHRKFLRQEFKSVRRSNIFARAVRAARAALNDHPRWVLLGVSLAALAIAAFYMMF